MGENNVLKIRLPYPPKELNPNKRTHWSRKSPFRKRYFAQCYVLARTVKPEFPALEIPLRITFHPPDRKKRDLDNMLASLKSGLDACAKAWGVDDHRFALTIRRAEPVKHGAVEIEVMA